MRLFSVMRTSWLWTASPNASSAVKLIRQSKQSTSEKLVELGHIILEKAPSRTSDTKIIIADLTGVAVQDIKIAEAVYTASL